MIAKLDNRPMLTALLALSTTVLVVVVITLATLLYTAAPSTAPAPSGSVGDNPPVVGAGGDFYGEGWNNYGHDVIPPKPAQKGDSVAPHQEIPSAHYGF